jgi:hypothetical protein
MRMVLLCGVLALVLLACQEIPLEDGPGAVNLTGGTNDVVLDIPRSNVTLEDDVVYIPPEPERKPWPVAQDPGTELDVLLGDAIGTHHPLITRAEFPLLSHPVIRVHNNRVLGYDETLKLFFGSNGTGKVLFTKDEETGGIGTFLLFEEGKTIFEYALKLDSGTFADIQGREIQILGHTYVISEASNMTVTLFGRSVASNLLFEEGERLVVNSTAQIGTVSRVLPNAISFRLVADGPNGDILLSPGKSLGETIGWRPLGSDLFDIRYKGAPVASSERIEFEQTRFGYRLITQGGTLPLVEKDGNSLVLGKVGERLRITPCQAGTYCVAPDDQLLLTAPNGTSFIYEYRSVNDGAENLVMRDEQGNRYIYEYTGTPGKDARTDIIIGDLLFRARIGPRDNATGSYNISVDQGFRSGRAELVTGKGIIIRIGDPADMVLPVEIIIPAALTADRKQQKISVRLVYDDGWRAVAAGNLTFVEDERTDDTYAVTPYGAIIHVEREDDALPLNVGDDLVVLIPDEPAYGTVVLEG